MAEAMALGESEVALGWRILWGRVKANGEPGAFVSTLYILLPASSIRQICSDILHKSSIITRRICSYIPNNIAMARTYILAFIYINLKLFYEFDFCELEHRYNNMSTPLVIALHTCASPLSSL